MYAKRKIVNMALVVFLLTISLSIKSYAKTDGNEVVKYAREFIGKITYTYGGNDPFNTDCSGFVCNVYQHFGIDLWDNRGALVYSPLVTNMGNNIANAEPGDLLIFDGHVGIYSGDGKMVDNRGDDDNCSEIPVSYYGYYENGDFHQRPVLHILRINDTNSGPENPDPDSINGKCGENVNYSYSEKNKTLTISGSGRMYDYSLDNHAPWYSFSIEKVFINDGITSIGYCAFDRCDSMVSIMIPHSVTSIETAAFNCCTSLTSITIPNGITSIKKLSFSNCTSLTTITIPYSVTSIENAAFLSCTSLTSITIPNSVTSIGIESFGNCTSLTSITIPNGVISIDAAFLSCASLTSVTIPNSVTSISYDSFYGCSSSIQIIGRKDSYAEEYAKRNNIKFTEQASKWVLVSSNIENINNICYSVNMDDETIIPKTVLDKAKENNVELILDYPNYSWDIKASDIVKTNSIDLEVKKVNNYVPMIDLLPLSNPLDQIKLTHSGELGFKATLNYFVGKQYAGKKVALYYYDESTPVKGLKLTQRVTVDKNGYAKFSFNHASYYVIDLEEVPSNIEDNSNYSSKEDNSNSIYESKNQYVECMENSINKVKASKPGEAVILDMDVWNSFSANFMEELAKNRKGDIVIKYIYKGRQYMVTINSNEEIKLEDGIKYYGPLKLAQMYGADTKPLK